MAYADDRLYNEVIRRKMGNLSSLVKVREIVPYLSCLTLSDREEIEAKRETAGNYCAMMVLLDNLRRRENWPAQFISALQTCEQRALANEFSEAYDRIRGTHTQRTTTATLAPLPPDADVSVSTTVSPAVVPNPTPSPAEASATITTVTSPSVPRSAPPLLTPSVEASALSATLSPINSSPWPYYNIASPDSTEAPALVSAPNDPVYMPPESAHPAEPPLLVLAPDARSPSPVFAPILTPSTAQSEVPVGSSESSKLGTSATSAPINFPRECCSNIDSPASMKAAAIVSSVEPPCEPVRPAEPPLLVFAPHALPSSPVSAPKVTPSTVQHEVPVSSRGTPTLGISGGLPNTGPSFPGPLSVAAPTLPTNPTSTSSQVNKPATTSQASASPEKNKVVVAVAESSSTVRHPIQETNLPGTVLPQDLPNSPTICKVVERVHTARSPNCQIQETSQGQAQASHSASTDAVAGCLSNFAAENEENFSKPGVLTEEDPFSISSDCLQISHMTMEGSPDHPARPAVSNHHRAEEPVNESISVNTDLMFSSSTATVPLQSVKNGVPEGDGNSYPNQPVEDHYESVQTESGTRMHIVEISEEPSVQNLNGQPPSMVGPTTLHHCGLSHNDESLVPSVSEDPSQHFQGFSQCIQGSNASEQPSPTASLTACTEPAQAAIQESELNASGQSNFPRSEQRERSQGLLHRFQSNAHLIAAAAVGMTAVFVALKYKYKY